MCKNCTKLLRTPLLFMFLQLHTTSSEQFKSKFYKLGFPALYVFGDSIVDAGNNNNLRRTDKSNFSPYGIDFEGGRPTGHYTNGKTIVDFISIHYGLPLVPPYLGLPDSQRSNISTGMNYASGGCGILQESGKKQGECLSLGNQIELFQKTVRKNLPKCFRTRKKLRKHLSESLFVVNIGTNDFSGNNKRHLKSKAFSQFLLDQFYMHLKRLYNLGVRKFLVNNLPPSGCFPAKLIKMEPKRTCNNHRNRALKLYNRKLRDTLQHLSSQLPDSSFVHSDYFNFLLELKATAHNYGISDTTHPCCRPYNGTNSCEPNSVPCEARDTHMFFDQFHPSQIANYIYAKCCLNSSSICTVL